MKEKEWIDVNEKLPAYEEMVFIYMENKVPNPCGTGCRLKTTRSGEHWHVAVVGANSRETQLVTHWMPFFHPDETDNES